MKDYGVVSAAVFYCDKTTWQNKYWGKQKTESFKVNLDDFTHHINVSVFSDDKSDIDSVLEAVYTKVNSNTKNPEEVCNSGAIYAVLNHLYFCAADGWIDITTVPERTSPYICY